jgi:hypothetical protein
MQSYKSHNFNVLESDKSSLTIPIMQVLHKNAVIFVSYSATFLFLHAYLAGVLHHTITALELVWWFMWSERFVGKYQYFAGSLHYMLHVIQNDVVCTSLDWTKMLGLVDNPSEHNINTTYDLTRNGCQKYATLL